MRDVTVQLPDNKKINVPFGMRASTILRKYTDHNLENTYYDNNPVIAVKINNELSSFSTPLEIDAELEPVELFTESGRRMYRHSICYLLAMASSIVFPERHLVVGHSLGDGYYYHFEDQEAVTDEMVRLLNRKMEDLVKRQLPIVEKFFSYHQAMEYFEKAGFHETALLLSFSNNPKVTVFSCDGYTDIAYEPLIDNTRLLSLFELRKYGKHGFLLRYPRQKNHLKIGTFSDNPVLFSIYKEYKNWGTILGVDCVGRLNSQSEAMQIKPFIQVAESLQNKKISRIADDIFSRKEDAGAVFIAGPSSSGKTTFTKKLGIQLKVLGFKPILISLDDYYRNRRDIALDENGNPDLEALHALDIPKLNSDLNRLFAGDEVELPVFNFKTGEREKQGKLLQLREDSIIIMEGIHGLNPDLTPDIAEKQKYKIYISALTQLNLDDHNRISTTDNRIIRRMVRDHQFRGMSASETLHMWHSVHTGEKHYIFPYQNNADAAFNSALDYELAVLKPYAEPLLKTIKPNDPVYTEAIRLLTFLEHFYPIPPHLVPSRSILREFIGGSDFSY